MRAALVILVATLGTAAVSSARPGALAPLDERDPVAANTLVFDLECAACPADAPVTLALLWLDGAEDGGNLYRGLVATDWAAGRFHLRGGGVALALEGEWIPDGWRVAVPLGRDGLPFRATAWLPGFTGDGLTSWPAEDGAGSSVLRFVPVEDALASVPELDPAATGECDLLVPKDQPSTVPVWVDGEARAWLIAPRGPAEEWTWQATWPGRVPLERIEVAVIPSDEGEHWGFRVPLAALAEAHRAARLDARGGIAAAPATGPVVSVGTAGVVDLEACPRVPAASGR